MITRARWLSLMCVIACGQHLRGAEPDARAQAVAAIEAVGGHYLADRYAPDRPIIKVNLEDTAASDDTLAALVKTPTITFLNLAGTKVTDRGAAHLSQLANLEELSLAKTSVTSLGLERLRSLKKMRTLILNTTKITDTGLQHLEGLPKLEELHLYGTRITSAGLPALAGMKSLRTLSIAETEISLQELQQFGPETLTHLFIDGRQSLIRPHLDLLPRPLRERFREDYPMRREVCWSDELPRPDESVKLELIRAGCRVESHEFDFGHRIQSIAASAKSDSWILQRNFVTLKRLERLELEQQEISEKFFAALLLSQLVELSLRDCRVGKQAFHQTQPFRRMCSLELIRMDFDAEVYAPLLEAPLQRLVLSEIKDSDAAVLAIAANLGDTLQELTLDLTGVSDEGAHGLSKCRELRKLSIRDTPLGGGALAEIAMLPQLEQLNLDYTLVSSAGLRHLRGHSRLAELSLAGTRVDDAGLAALAGLPRLRRLNLSFTGVTDAGLQALAERKSLQWIDVRGTRVTPVGTARLQLKTPQVTVLE